MKHECIICGDVTVGGTQLVSPDKTHTAWAHHKCAHPDDTWVAIPCKSCGYERKRVKVWRFAHELDNDGDPRWYVRFEKYCEACRYEVRARELNSQARDFLGRARAIREKRNG